MITMQQERINGSHVGQTRATARRRARIVAAAMLGLAVSPLAPISADAAPAATAMVQTQRMSQATLNSTQSGWYKKGQKLNLVCYQRGQSVKGYFSSSFKGGWDDLWYKVSDGHFVADVDIQTGSNNPVTAPCLSKATTAVKWANSQVGSMAYPGLCEKFVEVAYGTSGRYATAMAAYNSLRAAGQIRSTSTGIPAGALVFSSNAKYDGGAGHVMLSRGDGTFVSGGASTASGNRSTVQIYSSPAPAGGFLGWANAPASWPGR